MVYGHRTGRHVVFCLHAHLVFTTKQRGWVLTAEHLERLKAIFESVCADFENTLREFDGESDYAHVLVTYPPKIRLSELINSLKGVSSRRFQRQFPEIKAVWSVRQGRGALRGRYAVHRCRSWSGTSRKKMAAGAAPRSTSGRGGAGPARTRFTEVNGSGVGTRGAWSCDMLLWQERKRAE